jgi:hypothetical protein
MRKLLLILFVSLSSFTVNIQETELNLENTGSAAGSIKITVFSNIDKQFFQYNLKQQCLSISEGIKPGYAYGPESSRITIPVREFKCSNKTAYRDFLTLIKADQNPYLEIYIPDNSNVVYNKEDSVVLKGVSIIVAGTSKKYDLFCRIIKDGDQNRILNGTTGIKLTDLGILPPVRLLGLVRVKNEILINFEICLKTDR